MLQINVPLTLEFAAKINLTTYVVLACLGILMYLGMLLRILNGPFPYVGVVLFHYGSRIILVSLLTMLTFKIVIKSLFIMDFDRMAMIEEKTMLKGMAAFTTLVTGLHVGMEVFLRNHRGLEHYPRWCLSVYISKVGLIYILMFIQLKD